MLEIAMAKKADAETLVWHLQRFLLVHLSLRKVFSIGFG